MSFLEPVPNLRYGCCLPTNHLEKGHRLSLRAFQIEGRQGKLGKSNWRQSLVLETILLL